MSSFLGTNKIPRFTKVTLSFMGTKTLSWEIATVGPMPKYLMKSQQTTVLIHFSQNLNFLF